MVRTKLHSAFEHLLADDRRFIRLNLDMVMRGDKLVYQDYTTDMMFNAFELGYKLHASETESNNA